MSVWIPDSPCTPETCITAPAATAGAGRRLARGCGVLLMIATGFVLALVARRLRADARARVARAWTRLAVRAIGVRTTVTGDLAGYLAGDSGGVLLVANHISWLDPLVLSAARPCRMVSQHEVSTWPVLGTLVAGAGTIFHRRERLHALPGTVGRVRDALRAGDAVTVFPEATTLCGAEPVRFRAAFFQAAVDAGVPVRPIAVRYRDAYGRPATDPAYIGDDTMAGSLRRVIRARSLVAEVTALPEISPSELSGSRHDRRFLARLAQRAVADELGLSGSGTFPAEAAADRPGGCPIPDNRLVGAR
ncbi:1-acyl-sn-glycerol-3-phosphate acyltransferase [Microbispora sp. RL4-1S]|uniref:1-acyl-sn-glycerol-3-phosphate acyltransferase n=1 Tax=Microbispora oryzae TaxID=2806554 RepID=A0A941AI36_9ACTN|nr:lysophospholipid acyltransferase family protein [Microbispora oryzae]MBP2702763.1 1-acyl-sn-glycerol-3-phosphate acyltransferase [Microbispora oryzae]